MGININNGHSSSSSEGLNENELNGEELSHENYSGNLNSSDSENDSFWDSLAQNEFSEVSSTPNIARQSVPYSSSHPALANSPTSFVNQGHSDSELQDIAADGPLSVDEVIALAESAAIDGFERERSSEYLHYSELFDHFCRILGFLADAGQTNAAGHLNRDLLARFDGRNINDFVEFLTTMAELGDRSLTRGFREAGGLVFAGMHGSRYEGIIRSGRYDNLLTQIFYQLHLIESQHGLGVQASSQEAHSIDEDLSDGGVRLTSLSCVTQDEIRRFEWEVMLCNASEYVGAKVSGSEEDLQELKALIRWGRQANMPVREQLRVYRELIRMARNYVEKEFRQDVREHLGLANWLNLRISENELGHSYQGALNLIDELLELRLHQDEYDEKYADYQESYEFHHNDSEPERAPIFLYPLWSREHGFDISRVSVIHLDSFRYEMGQMESLYQAGLVGDDLLDSVIGQLARTFMIFADHSHWGAAYDDLNSQQQERLTRIRRLVLRELADYITQGQALAVNAHQILAEGSGNSDLSYSDFAEDLHDYMGSIQVFLEQTLDPQSIASESNQARFLLRVWDKVRDQSIVSVVNRNLHPHARSSFEQLKTIVSGSLASWEMGERAITIRNLAAPNSADSDSPTSIAWLNEVEDTGLRSQLELNISNFIRSLDTIKNELWSGYREKGWLSRLGSQLADHYHLGDRAEIKQATDWLTSWQQHLLTVDSLADWQSFYERFLSELEVSLLSGGVLYLAVEASGKDLKEELLNLGEMMVYGIALAPVLKLGLVTKAVQAVGLARGAAVVGQAGRQVLGACRQVGSRLAARAGVSQTLQATSGVVSQVRVASRFVSGVSRAAGSLTRGVKGHFTQARLLQMASAGELGAYLTAMSNYQSLSRASEEDAISWTKDMLATGLMMALTAGLAGTAVGSAHRNLMGRMAERFVTTRGRAVRLLGDAFLEAAEELGDMALRKALDGDFTGISGREFWDILAVSAPGGFKMGEMIELVHQAANGRIIIDPSIFQNPHAKIEAHHSRVLIHGIRSQADISIAAELLSWIYPARADHYRICSQIEHAFEDLGEGVFAQAVLPTLQMIEGKPEDRLAEKIILNSRYPVSLFTLEHEWIHAHEVEAMSPLPKVNSKGTFREFFDSFYAHRRFHEVPAFLNELNLFEKLRSLKGFLPCAKNFQTEIQFLEKLREQLAQAEDRQKAIEEFLDNSAYLKYKISTLKICIFHRLGMIEKIEDLVIDEPDREGAKDDESKESIQPMILEIVNAVSPSLLNNAGEIFKRISDPQMLKVFYRLLVLIDHDRLTYSDYRFLKEDFDKIVDVIALLFDDPSSHSAVSTKQTAGALSGTSKAAVDLHSFFRGPAPERVSRVPAGFVFDPNLREVNARRLKILARFKDHAPLSDAVSVIERILPFLDDQQRAIVLNELYLRLEKLPSRLANTSYYSNHYFGYRNYYRLAPIFAQYGYTDVVDHLLAEADKNYLDNPISAYPYFLTSEWFARLFKAFAAYNQKAAFDNGIKKIEDFVQDFGLKGWIIGVVMMKRKDGAHGSRPPSEYQFPEGFSFDDLYELGKETIESGKSFVDVEALCGVLGLAKKQANRFDLGIRSQLIQILAKDVLEQVLKTKDQFDEGTYYRNQLERLATLTKGKIRELLNVEAESLRPKGDTSSSSMISELDLIKFEADFSKIVKYYDHLVREGYYPFREGNPWSWRASLFFPRFNSALEDINRWSPTQSQLEQFLATRAKELKRVFRITEDLHLYSYSYFQEQILFAEALFESGNPFLKEQAREVLAEVSSLSPDNLAENLIRHSYGHAILPISFCIAKAHFLSWKFGFGSEANLDTAYQLAIKLTGQLVSQFKGIIPYSSQKVTDELFFELFEFLFELADEYVKRQDQERKKACLQAAYDWINGLGSVDHYIVDVYRSDYQLLKAGHLAFEYVSEVNADPTLKEEKFTKLKTDPLIHELSRNDLLRMAEVFSAADFLAEMTWCLETITQLTRKRDSSRDGSNFESSFAETILSSQLTKSQKDELLLCFMQSLFDDVTTIVTDTPTFDNFFKNIEAILKAIHEGECHRTEAYLLVRIDDALEHTNIFESDLASASLRILAPVVASIQENHPELLVAEWRKDYKELSSEPGFAQTIDRLYPDASIAAGAFDIQATSQNLLEEVLSSAGKEQNDESPSLDIFSLADLENLEAFKKANFDCVQKLEKPLLQKIKEDPDFFRDFCLGQPIDSTKASAFISLIRHAFTQSQNQKIRTLAVEGMIRAKFVGPYVRAVFERDEAGKQQVFDFLDIFCMSFRSSVRKTSDRLLALFTHKHIDWQVVAQTREFLQPLETKLETKKDIFFDSEKGTKATTLALAIYRGYKRLNYMLKAGHISEREIEEAKKLELLLDTQIFLETHALPASLKSIPESLKFILTVYFSKNPQIWAEFKTICSDKPGLTAGRLLRILFEKAHAEKMAQVLASWPGLLSGEIKKELKKTQEDNPPCSQERFESALSWSLGKNWKELFSKIDWSTRKRGSVCETVRAVKHDGSEIALKLLIPTRKEQIEQHLKEMEVLFETLSLFKDEKFAGVDPATFGKEYIESYRRELDLSTELENSDAIAKAIVGKSGLRMPKYDRNLSNENLLVMSWEQGLEIDKSLLPDERKSVIRGLWDLLIACVFKSGVLSDDLHTGNLRWARTPKQLLFWDFGRVTKIKRRDALKLLSFLKAIRSKNAATIFRALMPLMDSRSGKPERAVMIARIRQELANQAGSSTVSMAQNLIAATGKSDEDSVGMIIDSRFTLIIKTLLTIETVSEIESEWNIEEQISSLISNNLPSII